MSDYHARKAERAKAHARLHGVKMVTCAACSGSGIYDNTGSPPCGACGGTGRERGPLNRLPSDPAPPVYDWRQKLRDRERYRVLKKKIHEITSAV